MTASLSSWKPWPPSASTSGLPSEAARANPTVNGMLASRRTPSAQIETIVRGRREQLHGRAAGWARERRHVLDPAKEGDLGLRQHGEDLLRVEMGHILWCHDQESTTQPELKYQVLLDVGGARWKVYD